MPDPHLRKAMAEIRKLLKRYRIGGQLTLVSKTHCEFATEWPYWSVIQPETSPEGQPGIRVRTHHTWYRTPEEQRDAIEASLHCLYQFRDLAEQTFAVMDELITQLEAQSGLDIEHHGFSGYEPNPDA